MLKEISSIYGYQQITDVSSAVGLTVPTKNELGTTGSPVRAYIKVSGKAVRYRDDNVAPSATVGFPIAVGETLVYDGDLKKIKFYETAASAALDITYYG